MELKELARRGFEVAKGIINKGGDAMPVFMVEESDGTMGIMMTPWGSDDEKVSVFKLMRKMFADKGIKSYVFVCEVWCRRLSKAEGWDGVAPRESPDRVDTLMVDGWNRDGEHVSLMVEIDHKADGSREVMKEPESVGGPGSSQVGRAVNLLKPEVVGSVH